MDDGLVEEGVVGCGLELSILGDMVYGRWCWEHSACDDFWECEDGIAILFSTKIYCGHSLAHRWPLSHFEACVSIYTYNIPAFSIALANNSLQRTRLPNLAQRRKAPLSFRCRLYVSSGGGANRSLTMTGIRPFTRSVMV